MAETGVYPPYPASRSYLGPVVDIGRPRQPYNRGVYVELLQQQYALGLSTSPYLLHPLTIGFISFLPPEAHLP